jgi:DNA-binding IclR family transcriptional regulator
VSYQKFDDTGQLYPLRFVGTGMADEVPIKTAKRTLEVAEQLAETEGGTISEIADSLDLPRSTAYDYLQTLVDLEYAVHDENGYWLSTRFLDLGARRRRQMEIHRVAHPELKQLAEETGEHATLTIEEHGMGILLETVMGENAVQVITHDGMRTYLHTTAPGKIILAHYPRERAERILDSYAEGTLPAFASETITDREELFAELDRARERGYAFDTNEAIDGMRGVAAPIIRRDIDHVVGALSIYAPLNRTHTTEFEEEIPELLLQLTNVVELNLTHS